LNFPPLAKKNFLVFHTPMKMSGVISHLFWELSPDPEFVRTSESDLDESPPPTKASQAMLRLVLLTKVKEKSHKLTIH
jgi:hypothetical protein